MYANTLWRYVLTATSRQETRPALIDALRLHNRYSDSESINPIRTSTQFEAGRPITVADETTVERCHSFGNVVIAQRCAVHLPRRDINTTMALTNSLDLRALASSAEGTTASPASCYKGRKSSPKSERRLFPPLPVTLHCIKSLFRVAWSKKNLLNHWTVNE